MLKKSAFYIIYISLPVFIFCSSQESTYTIEVTDGVKFIHIESPLWGDVQKITLEFVRQIGDYDAVDENLQFNLPSDIDFDDNGNIYVLASGNDRIQKLDRDGKYINTIGRQGQGPGEFDSPQYIKIVNNESLYVIDNGNLTLQIFNLNGILIETIPFRMRFFSAIILSNGQILINGRLGTHPDFTHKEPNVVRIDKRGNVLQTYSQKKDYGAEFVTIEGNWASLAADETGNVYLTFRSQNRIAKISPDGDDILYFNRDRPYAESEKTYFKMIYPETQSGLMVLNNFYYYTALDSKNRMWVMSYNLDGNYSAVNEDKSNEFNLDIYDSDGILLESFPWEYSTNRSLIKIIGDKVYFAD